MITREIEKKVVSSLKNFPAVVLLGARQIGKTTLAKNLKDKIKKQVVYFDLENPTVYDKLLKDAYFFLKANQEKTVIIDEVQRLPQLFPLIRSLIDERRKNGKFILLGSADKDILLSSSESLAGRVSYIEMQPFFLSEVNTKKDTFFFHLLRGGFPRAYLAKNPQIFKEWFDGFITSYIEKDLRMIGLQANPLVIKRLITMLAGVNGNLVNYSMLGGSLGLSHPTVKTYIDFLEHAFLVRRLTPFFTNIGKRLTKSNKIYFRDTGMLNYFLNIYDKDSLINNAYLGNIFESYVIQQIVPKLSFNTTPHFYRTQAGAEIDVCLAQGNKVKLAIEIKFSSTPTLTQGNHIALQDLQNPDLLIIAPDGESYQKSKNISVVNIRDIDNYLKKYHLIER